MTTLAGPASIGSERPSVIRRVAADPRARIAAAVLAGLLLAAIWPSALAPADPFDCSLSRSLDAPSWSHPLGLDLQGCDVLSKAVVGTRTSLLIGIAAALGGAAIAVVLGGLAGWFGGAVDAIVSRAADTWIGLPLELVALVVLSMVADRGVALVAGVLALFGWPPMTRLMRAAVLRERATDHVTAARALGAGTRHLLGRHVLPASAPSVLTYAAPFAGVAIAAEATLTFFGVGLQLPAQSWGVQLALASQRLAGHPWTLAPGVLLTIAVLAFVLLGEAIRDALDPRAAAV